MITKNKLKQIQFICFDMDGTIYTSEGILMPSYHRGIEKFNNKYNANLKKPTIEELEHQIGQPVRIIFKNLFPELKDDSRLNELSGIVLSEFLDMIAQRGGKLFPNVYFTLEELKNKGYMIAIASNGRREYLQKILSAFNIEKYFEPLIAIDEKEITEKSHILRKYMQTYSLTNREILMVGDRSSDLEAAEKINCQFIGCSYGFAKNEIIGAENVIHDIKEILEYI